MQEEEGDDIQEEPNTSQNKHNHGVINIYMRSIKVNRLAPMQPQRGETLTMGLYEALN